MSVQHILILFIRIPYKVKICSFLFQLVEMQSWLGATVFGILHEPLAMKGISEEMLWARFVCFSTDGTADLTGPYRGSINPNLTIIYCINHKLELVVNDGAEHRA